MDGKNIEKKKLFLMLDEIDDPLILLSKDEDVLYANEKGKHTFGSVKGMKLSEIFNSESFLSKVRASSSVAESELRTYIYKKHTGDDAKAKGKGRERTYRVRTVPVYDNTLLIFKNVTREEKLMMVRQDFIANASHELKTPLTAIIGFAETLNEGCMGKEDAMKFASIIYKNGKHMERILSDLTLLTSLEKNDIEHTFTRFDAYKIVSEAISCTQFKADEKGIKVIAEKCSVDVLGNESLILQALINLISNAITYSDEEKKVVVSVEESSSYVNFLVRDKGMGIRKEDQERIFERFYRVDKARSRNSGGTGLGLSIVRHIAILHKGFITVESELGKGSLFTLKLPRPSSDQ